MILLMDRNIVVEKKFKRLFCLRRLSIIQSTLIIDKMSCNSCQSKFSFFTRENACPKCGFSYCSKCLKFKCDLPGDDNVKKVCGPCYNKLMSNSQSSSKNSLTFESHEASNTPMAPVDIEHKINSLENPVKPPIVMYKQGRWDKFKTGLDPVDQAIVDRLQKLKYGDKQPQPPTTEEIRRRLALLKDQDPDQVPPTNIHHVDKRSDQEKSEDLIRQYLETLELSSTSKSTGDLEERLNTLRGINPPKSTAIYDDDCDEAAVTKRIIEKAIAEAALEAKYGEDDDAELEIDAPERNSDDDSSCVMCDQTKDLVQCTGCTGDLYCLICFEDNHDDFEMKKHKAIPFKERRKLPY